MGSNTTTHRVAALLAAPFILPSPLALLLYLLSTTYTLGSQLSTVTLELHQALRNPYSQHGALAMTKQRERGGGNDDSQNEN